MCIYIDYSQYTVSYIYMYVYIYTHTVYAKRVVYIALCEYDYH